MSFYAVDVQAQALRRAQTDVAGLYVERAGGPAVLHLSAAEAAAASATGVHAAVTDTGSPVTVTTAITNPPYARNITATAGGVAGDVKAIQVTINGTNINDEVITEDLPAFTVNTTGIVSGSKAFKTVTSIVIPAHDGLGATTAIGFGDICGLPYEISENFCVIAAYLGATRESTLPAITVDADEFEKNTFDLNSALDGSTVDLLFVIG